MDIQRWPIFSLLHPAFINEIKLTSVFGNGNEAIIITKSDQAFGIGPNVSGCLGVGDQQNALEPILIPSLCGKRVKGFAFGIGPHVIAYSETGEIYGWGSNGKCEVGNEGSAQVPMPTVIFMPTVISSLSEKRIVEVACGSYHSLALCENGEVYAWGQNNCGQVGSGQTTNHTYPRKVNAGIGGKIVVSIACGQASSMALLENGEVYGWGYNSGGQLGTGNTSNQLSPIKILTPNMVIKKIVCGNSHTLALSDQGVLLSWGSNHFGQLGTGNKTNSSIPIQILSNAGRITDIAAVPYNHLSAAVCNNFKVYMWGQCKGQNILEPYLTPFNSLHEVFLNFSSPCVTYKPLKPKYSTWTPVSETIKNAFDDPVSSDLTIMVENKPIYVHKCILKLRSDYFKTMFQDHWPEDSQRVLEMNRNSYKIYRAFLQYLYTDEVDLSPEEALELLDQATECCIDPLKHRCEQIIKHGLTVENAAMLYAKAIVLDAKELEEFCLSFALNHMTAVVQTEGFLGLNECDMKKLILKASKRGIFKS